MNNQSQIPQHIAIVMDGNRRWARERGLPILEGHRRVADKVLEPLIEHAAKWGIKYITFWAFSTENWQRDKKEVEGIMRIFRRVIHKRWQRLHEKGVRVRVIGDISKFAPDIREALHDVVEQTKRNERITTLFALNYGGRDEMMRAMNKVISDKQKAISKGNKNLIPRHIAHITEDEFSQYLDTAGIPDPELIIRTGGEQRVSGFLLWQSEYSELYFPTWYMPEFTPDRLDEAIVIFAGRKRRFGK